MLPKETFASQVAVITGGATGIGFAIAQMLGRRRARVVLAGRNPDHVHAAAENFTVDADKLSVGSNAVVTRYVWMGGPRNLHSAVAKAGVVTLTRPLAVEWASHGIRVNAVCPDPTDTEGARGGLWPDEASAARMMAKIPRGRFGTVEKIATAAGYLLSPYADSITGGVLVVDGGEWPSKGLLS